MCAATNNRLRTIRSLVPSHFRIHTARAHTHTKKGRIEMQSGAAHQPLSGDLFYRCFAAFKLMAGAQAHGEENRFEFVRKNARNCHFS